MVGWLVNGMPRRLPDLRRHPSTISGQMKQLPSGRDQVGHHREPGAKTSSLGEGEGKGPDTPLANTQPRTQARGAQVAGGGGGQNCGAGHHFQLPRHNQLV